MAVHRLSRQLVYGCRGMICSNSPLAASVGIKVLQEGGNALTPPWLSLQRPSPMCQPGWVRFLVLLMKRRPGRPRAEQQWWRLASHLGILSHPGSSHHAPGWAARGVRAGGGGGLGSHPSAVLHQTICPVAGRRYWLCRERLPAPAWHWSQPGQ